MVKSVWLSDPAHSEVQFKVKHLMITTVTGYFRTFSVKVETEEDDFTKANLIEFTADINSIDTNNGQRDTHLKTSDFFSADKYPHLEFVGKQFEAGDDGNYLLTGDLTIRGITKPITLEVEYSGIVKDPYNQIKAGFTVHGKLKRKDFNLSWDAMTEAGQVVVSNDIKIVAEIQLIRQSQSQESSENEVEEESVAS